MSEEHDMNRTAKSLARQVANGTVTLKDAPAEMRAFKEAAGLLQWFGVKGGGVLNHASGERVKSWAALAARLLEEAGDNEAETGEQPLAHSAAFQAIQAVADRVPVAEEPVGYAVRIFEGRAALVPADSAEEPDAPVTVVMYRTQTPTIHLSEGTAVDAVITEEIIGVTEGLCESGASLECSLEDPSMGLLRTLPESMLPDQERTLMLQCLPCYEASAEAYVRKLHRA